MDRGILQEQIPKDIALLNSHWIDLEEARKNAIYSLTEQGQKYVERMAEQIKLTSPDILLELESIKCKYTKMSLRTLLRYVYEKYPQV